MEDLRKAAEYYLETASEEYKQRESRASGGGESPVDFYIRETKRCIRKCDVCAKLLVGFYLCCTECEFFEGFNYNLCVNCFYGGIGTFQHNHNSFADNHSVLAMHNEKRRKPTCVIEKYEGRGKQDSKPNSNSLSRPSSLTKSSPSNSFKRTPSVKKSSPLKSLSPAPSFKTTTSHSKSIVSISSSKHLNRSNSSVGKITITIDKEGIKKLACIAKAHYNAAPQKIRVAADKFFWRMVKEKGKSMVSMEDFVESMKEMRYSKYAIPELFQTIVNNRDVGMSIEESRTVYYIVVSERPFCSWCNCFIPDVYFCCSKCPARSYALCLNCYSIKAHVNHKPHYDDADTFFLDYTVLHTTIKPTSATSNADQSGSSSTAIVKRNPRDKVAAVLKIGNAILNAGGTVLSIASTLGACTIM